MLEPNSEYVISLRAYNNQGDGRPIYETTRSDHAYSSNMNLFVHCLEIKKAKLKLYYLHIRTQNEAAREPSTPLHPPLGLHAIVLSSTTVTNVVAYGACKSSKNSIVDLFTYLHVICIHIFDDYKTSGSKCADRSIEL